MKASRSIRSASACRRGADRKFIAKLVGPSCELRQPLRGLGATRDRLLVATRAPEKVDDQFPGFGVIGIDRGRARPGRAPSPDPGLPVLSPGAACTHPAKLKDRPGSRPVLVPDLREGLGRDQPAAFQLDEFRFEVAEMAQFLLFFRRDLRAQRRDRPRRELFPGTFPTPKSESGKILNRDSWPAAM